MNAVEIEEAVTQLSEQPFDPATFPYDFLEAFGNKDATINRLKTGATNKSDLEGGVLQHNNIHILTCSQGQVSSALKRLKSSPATVKQKAKFILATDGEDLQAEELSNGETIACAYKDFPNHFGFFLPLAGISTVKQITENAFDIRATSRLNRLYVELLKDNPSWGKAEKRHEMNHFMARLIFCFFSEDTKIFNEEGIFTRTIEQMSAKDSSNTHEVMSEIFRAMNTKREDRPKQKIARWAEAFPYVNGGLFSGSTEVPRFSKIARSYLLHVGNLDWQKINPDIFGSMIQAVADDDERGSLGMHYTSVPNILKVLNPLFLDDLRQQLSEAGNNPRMLLNLRKRLSKIRVFDPACGSGNFLVIAYKQMREIEFEINTRRDEAHLGSVIPLTNFRGIEINDFPAEIARLALIIAEYQCDVVYRGQQEALADFLPLDTQNWIVCGNALRLDWLSICPPTGQHVKVVGEDLFSTPLKQTEIDFENEGGETYICGNPPYLGSKWQTEDQKSDLEIVFRNYTNDWKSLDYVAGWFIKAAEYSMNNNAVVAFVATNSICQGIQVPILWKQIFSLNQKIIFAHTSFYWKNLASKNAIVIVVVVGFSAKNRPKILYSVDSNGNIISKDCEHISAYLVPGKNTIVEQSRKPISNISQMYFGNMPRDGGGFVLSSYRKDELSRVYPELRKFIRLFFGSEQMIQGKLRWCFWIEDTDANFAKNHAMLSEVLDFVRKFRMESPAGSTRSFSEKPHRFVQIAGTAKVWSIAIAKVSSEKREYIPIALLEKYAIVSDLLFAIYDGPLWNISLIASKLHTAWIAAVCGKMKSDYRYSNTLGWNTFPVPDLTEKNKADLTKCAEDILLAREAHFPATIADLYDPDAMPENLRRAHDRNDEVLERIYIGRRFKNDTERLEKLFELYTKMTAKNSEKSKKKRPTAHDHQE